MEFLSILLGGGIVSFVTFLIQRHDAKNDRHKEILLAIQELDKKIDAVDKKVDKVDSGRKEDSAIACRVRILRFADDMQQERMHSKDSWDQCLSDITSYEHYCNGHPEFKNGQTAATIEYITKSYSKRLEKHDFL